MVSLLLKEQGGGDELDMVIITQEMAKNPDLVSAGAKA
jgi:hypothetical protein